MATTKYMPSFKKDSFEQAAWDANQLVCGVDEVGVGCLAGPIVVAAVILPAHTSCRFLKDSKTLTDEELQQAYRWIMKKCLVSWASASHRSIDYYNNYHANLRAMKRAVTQLCTLAPQKPTAVLVDAMPLNLNNTPYQHIEVAHFSKGEQKSRSIAAASIVAKIKRDQLMIHMSTIFPGYSLHQHHGYATAIHREALKELGHSLIHRKSYLNNIETKTLSERHEQQTIC